MIDFHCGSADSKTTNISNERIELHISPDRLRPFDPLLIGMHIDQKRTLTESLYSSRQKNWTPPRTSDLPNALRRIS